MVGIFDGHGGERASQYLSEYFTQRFLARYSITSNIPNAFHESKPFFSSLIAFSQLDNELAILAGTSQLFDTEGSTATIALVLNDELYLSYVGDSEAILVQNSGKNLIKLCKEVDTAENVKEAERVEKAGGIVLKVGSTQRVQGELALTRSFGDSKYKTYVTAEPHIVQQKLNSEDEFLIIATDGLWNVLTHEEVGRIVTELKDLPENEIAEKLYAETMEKNCTDNVTIAVINLKKRRKLMEEGSFYPPAAPTSRYTKENRKAFMFPQEGGNLID